MLYNRYLYLGTILALSVTVTGCSLFQTGSTNNDVTAGIADTDVSFDEDFIEVLTADAYGEDLVMVERYPGSIRSYYATNEYETDLTYQTTASEAEVRSFYDEKLKTDGWENTEEATDYMEYMKGDEDNPEIFTLYLTPYEDQDLLEYELVYEPTLTEAQLEELNDDEEVEFEL